jgi:hypothetical protein
LENSTLYEHSDQIWYEFCCLLFIIKHLGSCWNFRHLCGIIQQHYPVVVGSKNKKTKLSAGGGKSRLLANGRHPHLIKGG